MGTLSIYSKGSFSPGFVHTSHAKKHGHAAAILDAVSFLMGKPMREAIAQDAALRLKGFQPQEGFEDSVAAWLDVFQETGALSDAKQSISLPSTLPSTATGSGARTQEVESG